MNYTVNRYLDVVLDPASLPGDPDKFKDMITTQIAEWKTSGKSAIWLEIPIQKSQFIQAAIDVGFKAHHCTESYFMFTLWLGGEEVKIPLYGTHIVRVEALLLRDDPSCLGVKQVLVVKERYTNYKRGKDWKLLSGAVEPGEFINEAIVREVKEEVGLCVKFCTVVGHGNRVSTKFGRNEIFFCCHVVLSNHKDNTKYEPIYE